MAQVDVQWPSEDEDFDATVAKANTSKPVKVADTNEPAEPTESSEPEAPEEPPADVQDTATEVTKETEPPDPEPDPEESLEEPESNPSSTLVATTETAAEAETETVPVPTTDTPTVATDTAPKRRRGSLVRSIVELLMLAGLIGLGLWGWTLYSDNKDLKQQVMKLNANPQIAIQKQTDDLIAKVGRLITLPAGETPTIANVSDATAAKKQSAFFNSAQNGDKVLMYVKAGEAILYRPSTGKIILVAPLTFNNNTATSSTSTTTKATR